MNIKPVENTSFGILVKPARKRYYAPNCWNIKSIGKYKDYDIKIYDDYMNKCYKSTLITISKAGKWIKSKLKYFDGKENKVLWSYAK
mgnify:CR=1 FL=1